MKVSVIVTSMNAVSTISATLDSIKAQTYKNLEVILVDGASTDGTQNVVKRYGTLISKFISEKDRGSSDALNKGFAISTGEIVTFLNADDCFASPQVVGAVVEAFQADTDVGYVGGALQWVLPDTGEKLKICQSRPDRMLQGCNAFLPGSFFKRQVIKSPPFTDEIDFANDYDLLCDVLVGQKSKFKVLPQVLIYFTLGGRSNLSKNRVQGKMDLFQVRKKYFGLMPALFFAAPELAVAYLQGTGFRPFTWARNLKRQMSHHER